MILTERDFIGFCIRSGWKKTALPGLRSLWRKYGFKNVTGDHVVKYKGRLIENRRLGQRWIFPDKASATEWANWNFKGNDGWEVVPWDESMRGSLK